MAFSISTVMSSVATPITGLNLPNFSEYRSQVFFVALSMRPATTFPWTLSRHLLTLGKTLALAHLTLPKTSPFFACRAPALRT